MTDSSSPSPKEILDPKGQEDLGDSQVFREDGELLVETERMEKMAKTGSMANEAMPVPEDPKAESALLDKMGKMVT